MDYKLIGSPCGQHGPYTFYKALKYNKNGKTNILALSEFFFVKLWTDSDLISIGELQLLWEDKNSEQTLASLRLYILPENTPDGRTDIHGQDEVLAINEKVVIRVEDLLTWITQATDWHWGLSAVWARDRAAPSTLVPPFTFTIDMDDVNKEKDSLEAIHWETQTGVVVLSYPRYCRFRGVMKRLEGVEEKWLSTEVRMELVVALGGFTVPWKNTRVLFCKETFDYPDLEGHELLCNHLAPKLKGRPRKRKRTNTSRTESDTESESSQSTASSSTSRPPPKTYKSKPGPKVGMVKPRLRCTLEVTTTPRRPARGPSTEEKNFMTTLHTFMRDRKTPIGRIPVVGFKEVNLFKLYRKVTDLGGYEVVTAGKLWKYVYQVMGGDMSSTSAATLSRRHYEKLLLPYERHIFGVTQNSPQPKLKASLALPPAPAASTTTQKTTGGLRNIRLKQEKTSPVSSGKENIPERREMTTLEPVKKEPVEAPDRPSEDTSIKMSVPRAMSPALKKQKLEILKEGGLEVTPVGRVSVIQEPAPVPLPPPSSSSSSSSSRPSRVSITVTPDIPHLICPPHTGKTDDEVERKKELQRDRMRQYRWRKCQQELEQSRIHQMKNHEMLLERQGPYQLTSSEKGEQIELTSKRRRSGPSKIPPKRPVYGNPKDAVPLMPYRAPTATAAPGEVLDLRTKPRLNVGHNLEITLVPRNPPTAPPPAPVQSVYRYTKPPPLPIQPPQVYLSALYNNMFPRHRPPPAFHLPAAAASPFNAALLYKELLRRQGYFPSLDGATSITLVGQTPTSK